MLQNINNILPILMCIAFIGFIVGFNLPSVNFGFRISNRQKVCEFQLCSVINDMIISEDDESIAEVDVESLINLVLDEEHTRNLNKKVEEAMLEEWDIKVSTFSIDINIFYINFLTFRME